AQRARAPGAAPGRRRPVLFAHRRTAGALPRHRAQLPVRGHRQAWRGQPHRGPSPRAPAGVAVSSAPAPVPRGRRKASVVGLLLATGVFIAIAIGVLLVAQRFIADANQVAHTRRVISHIDAFEARLRDAESAQRGYLLTGDVDYLADYRSNHQQLD